MYLLEVPRSAYHRAVYFLPLVLRYYFVN